MNAEKEGQDWKLLLFFAALKLVLHFLTNTNYGFHRDEFLYLALGERLFWGYMEVPPVIAVFGKLALSLGGQLFTVRLLPALIGSVTVFLLGVMVKDLGGKKWAQSFACLAFVLSPAFMRSNMLFQPVSFDQFCWFLSAFFIVRLVKFQQPKYWLYLGIAAGLGFLTKYSIVFFYAAFFLAILFTPHRHWLKTQYPYFAAGIALFMALPNLLWQYQHHLPVLKHMAELSQTQLRHVQAWNFLQTQLRFHHAALLIWLPGLLYLLLSKKLSIYRILGLIYIFIILIFLVLKGKGYYALGAYPMLMAAGGMAVENFLQSKTAALKPALAFLLIMLTIPLLPYGLPVLPIQKMQGYWSWMKDNLDFVGPLRWEDGKIHALPQDYADMFGWEEIAAKVGKLYHGLSPAEQQSCMIFGGGYAHASAINYYRKKYDLPEVCSFNGSFLMWAPDSTRFDRQIMVDDVLQTQSSFFVSMQLVDSVQTPQAREKGYIYYRSQPQVDVQRKWREIVAERKSEFNF